MHTPFSIREVEKTDLDELLTLEETCFETDRLSPRRMKHWIKAQNRIFLVGQTEQGIVGYVLVLLHRGTRLARLYSIAVGERARGLGLGKAMLVRAEEEAVRMNRLFMRLEVAVNNQPAINLYRNLGYVIFDTIEDYYEDHGDALRMQKTIRQIQFDQVRQQVPWYRQQTEFTCGPASLMMAMASLSQEYEPHISEELAIWREATTIFMTSGHGGCHPVGLGLAAHERGFQPEIYINLDGPLFVEGVRRSKKKEIISQVDEDFRRIAKQKEVKVHFKDVTQNHIEKWLNQNKAIIILISTYRFDGKKAPHWVTVSAMDELCIYIHDSDPEEEVQQGLDCQYMPIAREDFDKMSSFGSQKLRCCVVLSKQ